MRQFSWFIALSLALAAGCGDGSDGATGGVGPEGTEGPSGTDGGQAPAGLDEFSPLPGVVVELLRVAGASGADGTFQVGDTLSVTFRLKYGNGSRLLLNLLDFFEMYVYGPTSNYQPVLARKTDIIANAVANADGTYTYTFATPIPATYLAPANDSTDIQYDPGAAAPELSGRPLLPGTYTVGAACYRTYAISSGSFRDAGNAVFHFLFGGATTIEPREVVVEADCAQCHNELRIHGGFRRKPELCFLCHSAGAEDGLSSDPEKATPGTSIDFRDMIHRIHRGRELRQVVATENSSDPYRYLVIGRNSSVHDYSDIAFPWMPGRTGFNQQTRNCAVCHGSAADGDAWYTRASRAACGACHDDVDFSDGTRLLQSDPLVDAGTLDRDDLWNPNYREIFHVPQADDSSCMGCHADTVLELGSRHVHEPPLQHPDGVDGLNGIIGIRVNLISVTGGTGANGSFEAGDNPQVTFQIVDEDGTPLTAESVASINGLMAGPTGNYQRILPTSSSTSTVNLKTGLTGIGPFTVSLGVIPATYPRQRQENKRESNPGAYPGWTGGDFFNFEDGWGERKDQPLDPGTYTIGVYAYRQFTRDGTNFRETSETALQDVLLEGATELEPYAGNVTDERCNSCHGDLRLHGAGRKGVRNCILCHTAGAEDSPRDDASDPEAPEPDTIDFRVMIHKLHNARELSVVKEGGTYDLSGDDYSTGLLPAMPGEAKNCANCHATDAWKNPAERSDVRIWMKTCGSCHDSAIAQAHISINTVGTVTTGDPATNAVEACSTCHGPDTQYAVDKVHIPR
jgi:hypothetical protein